MMKGLKQIAAVLVLCMLVAWIPAAARAAGVETISEGEEKTFSVLEFLDSIQKGFSFTPSESGTYVVLADASHATAMDIWVLDISGNRVDGKVTSVDASLKAYVPDIRGEFVLQQGQEYTIYVYSSNFYDSDHDKLLEVSLRVGKLASLERLQVYSRQSVSRFMVDFGCELFVFPYPEFARVDYDELIWTSSNPAVARPENGIILTESVGEADIRVTTAGGASGSFHLSIKGRQHIEPGQPETLTLTPGECEQYSFTPQKSGDYVFYMCYDKVNRGVGGDLGYCQEFDLFVTQPYEAVPSTEKFFNNFIYGYYCTLEAGEVYYFDASNSRECDVTATVYLDEKTSAQSISIIEASLPAEGYLMHLEVAAVPLCAPPETYTWESSDESVLWVYSTGKTDCYLMCESAGTATITVTSDSGLSASHTITVSPREQTEATETSGGETETTASITSDTVKQAIEAAGDTGNVTISLGETAPEASTVELSAESIQSLAGKNASLTIDMSNLEVTMDAQTLEAVAGQTGGDTVSLRVEQITPENLTQEQQQALEGREVAAIFSAEIMSEDTYVHDFQGGTVTIRLAFTPAENTQGSDYTVFYVAEDGTVQEMETEYADGYLIFTVTHFSEYVVVNTGTVSSDTPTEQAGESPDSGTDNSGSFQAAWILLAVVAAGVGAGVWFAVRHLRKKNG